MMSVPPSARTEAAKPQTILVVEDEMLLALMLEDMLIGLGYQVLKAPRVAKALEIAARHHLDCAILDVNLNGESSYAVANRLRDSGVPFIFSTGYGFEGVDPAFQDIAVLDKPFHYRDLVRLVNSALTVGA